MGHDLYATRTGHMAPPTTATYGIGQVGQQTQPGQWHGASVQGGYTRQWSVYTVLRSSWLRVYSFCPQACTLYLFGILAIPLCNYSGTLLVFLFTLSAVYNYLLFHSASCLQFLSVLNNFPPWKYTIFLFFWHSLASSCLPLYLSNHVSWMGCSPLYLTTLLRPLCVGHHVDDESETLCNTNRLHNSVRCVCWQLHLNPTKLTGYGYSQNCWTNAHSP